MSGSLMLDSQTIATVQETIPLLVKAGPEFTKHMYSRMFSSAPELKDIFNMSNQRNGDQQKALFNAVALYAGNLENLAVLAPVVEKIAQKHTSFLVQPEQYELVGKNIIATIDEMFSPGEAVLEAWTKAYKLLASIFIDREAQIYKENASKPGGWSGTRKFRIAEKIPRSSVITSFEFEPVDAAAVASYRPGQYLAIWLRPKEFPNQEIRQYSLTRKANGRSYRIAVKREANGLVSNWLHNSAKVGDVVDLVVPVGDFFMECEPTTPVALISAGVGQTPLLAMLDTLSQSSHPAQVSWLHTARNGDAHAFSDEVEKWGSKLPHFTSHVWYSSPTDEDRAAARFHSEGHMSLSEHAALLVPPETHCYVCGPVKFMQNVTKQLTDLGVKTENIHYEVFGPHKVL